MLTILLVSIIVLLGCSAKSLTDDMFGLDGVAENTRGNPRNFFSLFFDGSVCGNCRRSSYASQVFFAAILAYSSNQHGDISALTYTFLATAVPGGIPTAGYVQVETFRTGVGAGQRTTLWFGAAVDYALTSDGAPQRVLDEANPWSFWRMSD